MQDCKYIFRGLFECSLADTRADVDRQLDRMFGAPRGEQQQRMIQGGQAGQEGQQGQVQKQGQQGQQGQVAQRDMFRNRMLAGRGFKVDVSETPQNYIVRADLPGVDKKDIKIEVGCLRISLDNGLD